MTRPIRNTFTAPVSGTVSSIVRGEKKADGHQIVPITRTTAVFPVGAPKILPGKRGNPPRRCCWPYIIRRLYGTPARPGRGTLCTFTVALTRHRLHSIMICLCCRGRSVADGFACHGAVVPGQVHLGCRIKPAHSVFHRLPGKARVLRTTSGRQPGIQILPRMPGEKDR